MDDPRPRVVQIIGDVLELDDSQRRLLEATTSDLHIAAWDSARHVEIIVALEDAFGIQVPAEDIARLNHVQKIVQYLRTGSCD